MSNTICVYSNLEADSGGIIIKAVQASFIQVTKVHVLAKQTDSIKGISLPVRDAQHLWWKTNYECKAKAATYASFTNVYHKQIEKEIVESGSIGDSIWYTYDSLINDAELLVAYVQTKPPSLSDNEYFLPITSFEIEHAQCEDCGVNGLLHFIGRKLVAKGFSISAHTFTSQGSFGQDYLNALTRYQEKYGLPVGNLNIETLKHLGVPGY